MMKTSTFRPQQRGMVLVTALLLLIVVTILAVGMFRSFGLDERIAGNVREKNRALNAAESAEQAAEYWLVNNASTGVACTGFTTMPTGQICTNALTASAVTQLPWTAGVNYVPTNMSVSATAPGQNTFLRQTTILHHLSRLDPERACEDLSKLTPRHMAPRPIPRQSSKRPTQYRPASLV